jgi:predicted Fe-Mo cluster-binding NifX family protein
MKIAFTTKGETWDAAMDPRFGRTEFLLLFDDQNDKLEVFDNRSIAEQAHGAGTKTAQKLFEMNPDVLITGNGPGGNASMVLEKSGIKIYAGAGQMSVKEAFEAFKKGTLEKV